MSATVAHDLIERARRAVAAVVDPELPGLSIEEIGILRSCVVDSGRVVVTITPTFSGCPAIEAIRADLDRALTAAGIVGFELRTSLSPPWSSDWITPAGRGKLAAAGIAPPSGAGPVTVTLDRRLASSPLCPQCGSAHTTLLSAYAATPCTSLYRCDACREPFDAVKTI